MHYLAQPALSPPVPVSPRIQQTLGSGLQPPEDPAIAHGDTGDHAAAQSQYVETAQQEGPFVWATQLLELAKVQAEQAKLIAYYRNELSRAEQTAGSSGGRDQMESLKIAMELMRLAQDGHQVSPQAPVTASQHPAAAPPSWQPQMPAQAPQADPQVAPLVDRFDRSVLSEQETPMMSCLDRDVPGCYLPESNDPAWYEAYRRIETAEASIISCFLVLVFFVVISRHMDFSAPYAKPKFGKKSRSSSSRTASSSAAAAIAPADAKS